MASYYYSYGVALVTSGAVRLVCNRQLTSSYPPPNPRNNGKHFVDVRPSNLAAASAPTGLTATYKCQIFRGGGGGGSGGWGGGGVGAGGEGQPWTPIRLTRRT